MKKGTTSPGEQVARDGEEILAIGRCPLDACGFDRHNLYCQKSIRTCVFKSTCGRSPDSHLADAEVTVERVDLDGYPSDALVEYATEVDASLLVVGTWSRGELASLILGSTSHRATYLASCDVLVVKNGDWEG